jgi:hypothetical protein
MSQSRNAHYELRKLIKRPTGPDFSMDSKTQLFKEQFEQYVKLDQSSFTHHLPTYARKEIGFDKDLRTNYEMGDRQENFNLLDLAIKYNCLEIAKYLKEQQVAISGRTLTAMVYATQPVSDHTATEVINLLEAKHITDSFYIDGNPDPVVLLHFLTEMSPQICANFLDKIPDSVFNKFITTMVTYRITLYMFLPIIPSQPYIYKALRILAYADAANAALFLAKCTPDTILTQDLVSREPQETIQAALKRIFGSKSADNNKPMITTYENMLCIGRYNKNNSRLTQTEIDAILNIIPAEQKSTKLHNHDYWITLLNKTIISAEKSRLNKVMELRKRLGLICLSKLEKLEKEQTDTPAALEELSLILNNVQARLAGENGTALQTRIKEAYDYTLAKIRKKTGDEDDYMTSHYGEDTALPEMPTLVSNPEPTLSARQAPASNPEPTLSARQAPASNPEPTLSVTQLTTSPVSIVSSSSSALFSQSTAALAQSTATLTQSPAPTAPTKNNVTPH